MDKLYDVMVFEDGHNLYDFMMPPKGNPISYGWCKFGEFSSCFTAKVALEELLREYPHLRNRHVVLRDHIE